MTIAPAMTDLSIEYPPELLAEAVRWRLDASPSDLWQSGAGTLRVERAWLPIYDLGASRDIVLSILCGDDKGETVDRKLTTIGEIDLGFSVQKHIAVDWQSIEGRAECSEVARFSERCLKSAYARIVDSRGNTYTPLRFQRAIVNDTLIAWNQFSVVFSITYKRG